MDNKKVSALILLDLSSAFDTIDHHILLSRLSSYFEISGLALQLLTSYLQNRTQTVCIDSKFLTAITSLHRDTSRFCAWSPSFLTLYYSTLSCSSKFWSVFSFLCRGHSTLYFIFTSSFS